MYVWYSTGNCYILYIIIKIIIQPDRQTNINEQENDKNKNNSHEEDPIVAMGKMFEEGEPNKKQESNLPKISQMNVLN